MAAIRVKLAGETLGQVDFEDLTLKDAFAIKSASGLTPMEMFSGLEKMDPDALQTIVWFIRMKSGDNVARGSIDFRIRDLETEEVGEGGVEFPNAPTSGTSEGDGTDTSGS